MPLPSQQRADDALMATDGVSGDHVLVGFVFFFKLSCGVSCTGKWIFIIMLIMYYIAWLKLKLRQARGCYLAEATPASSHCFERSVAYDVTTMCLF